MLPDGSRITVADQREEAVVYTVFPGVRDRWQSVWVEIREAGSEMTAAEVASVCEHPLPDANQAYRWDVSFEEVSVDPAEWIDPNAGTWYPALESRTEMHSTRLGPIPFR